MILTDDQVSLYGDNLASTTATTAPPGCGLLQPIGMGFFCDTDPIVTVHVVYVWGMRKKGMCLGRNTILDPEVLAMTPNLGSFRRRSLGVHLHSTLSSLRSWGDPILHDQN